MKRFLCLLSVVFVLISCFVLAVFAENTVATSTDIYLSGYCHTNSSGTMTAVCPVVGGFPLGFTRSDSVSDTVPSISYWEFYGQTIYYRVNLGTIGTGQTNIAFSMRILDELSSAYNNDVSSSLCTLRIRSDQGDVSYSSLTWSVKDSQVFTGQSYSNVSFSCVLNSDTTVTNAYMVIGIAYDTATIPAIVKIPQYKWSGPVNGFGSTWYQDMDIYPNGDQYYIPVDEATYMQACYDAYSAASYFSYFGQGMMSQTLDLDIIIDAVQEESRILQAQNAALANNIISEINSAESSINMNIDEAEESLNANIDEESQAIQGAISDQTSDLEGAIQDQTSDLEGAISDQTDAVVGGIEDQTSDLESYLQPIIDHYAQVTEAGETIEENVSQEDINGNIDTADYGLDQANNATFAATQMLPVALDEASGYFGLISEVVSLFFNFGINSSPLGACFLFLVGFVGVFLVFKVLKE